MATSFTCSSSYFVIRGSSGTAKSGSGWHMSELRRLRSDYQDVEGLATRIVQGRGLDRNDKNGAESRAVPSGNYRTEPDCLVRSVLFESAYVGGRSGSIFRRRSRTVVRVSRAGRRYSARSPRSRTGLPSDNSRPEIRSWPFRSSCSGIGSSAATPALSTAGIRDPEKPAALFVYSGRG